MTSLEVLSLQRPEDNNGLWSVTFKLLPAFLESPALDISPSSVRVQSSSGEVSEGSLPTGCGPIDEEKAVCKVSRKKGQLTISWLAASRKAQAPALPAQVAEVKQQSEP